MSTEESTIESVNIEIEPEVTYTTKQVWSMFVHGGLLAAIVSPLLPIWILSENLTTSVIVLHIVIQYASVFFVVASWCGVGLLYVGYRPSRHNREGNVASIEQASNRRRIPLNRGDEQSYIDME